MLTGTALISRNLAKKLREEGRPEAEELEEITSFIQEADNHASGLSKGLVPVELEENGLAAALRQLAHNAERLFNVRCTFGQLGSASNLDSTAATHLYRIAQEALSKAVKHGRARGAAFSGRLTAEPDTHLTSVPADGTAAIVGALQKNTPPREKCNRSVNA